MIVDLNIVGGFDKSYKVEFSPQEILNLYPTINQSGKKALFPTPGLSLSNGRQVNTQGGIRQLFVSKLIDNMHAVIGNALYQFDSSLNVIFGLAIDTDSGTVQIKDNDYQIIFADGVSGYIYDKDTNIYSKITSPGFPPSPETVANLAGFFLVNKKDTNEIYYSTLNDGSTWNANDRFDLTSYPDIVVGLAELHGRLYILGKRCTEIWFPSGNAEVPFTRDENLLIEFGCAATGTIANEQGLLVWLAHDKQGVTSVVATDGSTPKRISTPNIEAEFQGYENTEDASAFVYIEKGNIFYQLNFMHSNRSWLYNFTTKRWSQLAYKDINRHRAECHAFFNEKHFVGDYENPYLYHFSIDYTSDNEVNIKRRIVSHRFYPNKNRGFVLNRLSFVMEEGIGKVPGHLPPPPDEYIERTQPYLFLRISRDGGITYGNQLSSKLGKIGEYEWRTEFYRLGTMDSFVLELEFYNKTNTMFLGATGEIGQLEQ